MVNYEELRRPLAELAHNVESGKYSAEELVQASLKRFADTAEYHTALELNMHALEEARAVDKRLAAGERLPLAGVPFAAKDNYLTASTHTTAASNILAPFEAPYEGPAIQRLKAAGAVLVAKLNLDAFAHGGSTENSDFGPTKNPHDPSRVPGGSSGGSAAAVALGQVAFALGSDTGGSIRQPASMCGVVGFKPTYGLVPRTGVVAMASSTDVLGPLTNHVGDVGYIMDVIAGPDASDATSIERDEDSYSVPVGDLKGRRIGLIKEYLGEGLDGESKTKLLELVEQLKARGAHIEEVSVPATELALAAYYILVPAEISSNLARYDGVKYGHSSKAATNLEETYLKSRSEGFGAEAKRRIMIGTYVLSSGYYDAYYKRAQRVRTKLVEDFAKAFSKYDLLLGPTAPNPAWRIGEKGDDPVAFYLEDVMTVAVSLVGIPAIVVPMAQVGGLPIGVQLMAPQRHETSLLAAARAVETVIGDWTKR
ncbi:MAG TPA: Asp-tRNA(Asn)/Glu-tRNA(Gln) amidotransferase subunit GatA [Candidatus Saccharimonadia bacterium]|jgi:aspartyl-tRNA(Asn)/glutamyl-tRNA(Gln) amidotransferase subunit A|nr:Asp-tRNA(Asn)/Glu-tRNA(Gln) amidotransferase subunit GatA [Candidatus Saccharimonadia bacterium]